MHGKSSYLPHNPNKNDQIDAFRWVGAYLSCRIHRTRQYWERPCINTAHTVLHEIRKVQTETGGRRWREQRRGARRYRIKLLLHRVFAFELCPLDRIYANWEKSRVRLMRVYLLCALHRIVIHNPARRPPVDREQPDDQVLQFWEK